MLTITFEDEAWHWMYDYLKYLTERELVVELNGRLVKLINTDSVEYVYIHPWDEVEDQASRLVEQIPLFDSGMPTITKIHVW